MFNTLRQKLGQFTKMALTAAMQGSGTAALYLGSSTLLAAMLITAILAYAWDIDRGKWYRALAILRGVELAETQKAVRDRVAEISYEEMIADRAKRLRREEFSREITPRATSFQLPPEDSKPATPPPPSDADRIDAYVQRVNADKAKAQSAGLEEQTRLIENMMPDQAKEVIRRFWKDGAYQRVLQILLAMEDKPREKILFAMRESNDEELKDLCEILQRIGDGDPMTSIIDNAAKEP